MDDDAIKDGFREPPALITKSCQRYMGRVVTLRDFLGTFFQFAKVFQTVSSMIEGAPDLMKAMKEEAVKKRSLRKI